MENRFTSTVLFCLITSLLFGQNQNNRLIDQGSVNFNREVYLYQFLNNSMDLEKRISYVAPLNFFDRLEGTDKLTDEEGGDGYVIEVHFPLKFPVLQRTVRNLPKDKYVNRLWHYSRLYLDYAFHTRVTRSPSSPILPPTNRFGIRFDKVMTVNVVRKVRERKEREREDFNFYQLEERFISDEEKIRQEDTIRVVKERFGAFNNKRVEEHRIQEGRYHFTFASFYLHHYSNGQDTGVFVSPGVNRNNYLGGDFSTNFWRVSYSWHQHNRSRNHVGLTLGYQKEIGNDDGFLSFRQEQENRYGRQRIVFIGQVLSRIPQTDFALFEIGRYLFRSMRFRTEVQYILDSDDLVDYPHDKKYPFGIHFYADFHFRSIPSMGLMFHYYRGRDYLNIRYDDPITAWQIGLSLEIGRFTLNPFDEELGM